MRVELKRLQRELHHTIVYVTHDQEEAMSIADRIAVMEAGEIRQVGTPAEIYNLPNSRYVAELIGAPPMNFVDGTLAEGGRFEGARGAALDRARRSGRAPARRRSRCGPRTSASIPPGRATGNGRRGCDLRGRAAGRVYHRRRQRWASRILKVQAPGQPQFTLGEGVRLALDPDRCHLFHGETGDADPLRPLRRPIAAAGPFALG